MLAVDWFLPSLLPLKRWDAESQLALARALGIHVGEAPSFFVSQQKSPWQRDLRAGGDVERQPGPLQVLFFSMWVVLAVFGRLLWTCKFILPQPCRQERITSTMLQVMASGITMSSVSPSCNGDSLVPFVKDRQKFPSLWNKAPAWQGRCIYYTSCRSQRSMVHEI